MSNKLTKIDDYVIVAHYIRAIRFETDIKIHYSNNFDEEEFKKWKQAIVDELKANMWSEMPKVDLTKEYIYSNKYNLRHNFISAYMGLQKFKYVISTQNVVYSLIALREINYIYDKVTKEYLKNVIQ